MFRTIKKTKKPLFKGSFFLYLFQIDLILLILKLHWLFLIEFYILLKKPNKRIQMKHFIKKQFGSSIFILILTTISGTSLFAQSTDHEAFIGKWDLNVTMGDHVAPSWLEVKLSGIKTLVGYFVAESGSARPISKVNFDEGMINFSIPPQWSGGNDMHLSAKVSDGQLQGQIMSSLGEVYSFTGSKAPLLKRNEPIAWTKAKPLFNGMNTDGWIAQLGEENNQWVAKDGVLVNPKSGSNLITKDAYEDFKLHIEFKYPANSNSGIYLRGRYEVQVEDSYGKEPSSILLGGVYGFLSPNENVAKKPGEWQSYDITLIGRKVTIEANGKTILWNQSIPGITGGAIDSNEGAPGPIMLQGDHGEVQFRNISIQVPKS